MTLVYNAVRRSQIDAANGVAGLDADGYLTNIGEIGHPPQINDAGAIEAIVAHRAGTVAELQALGPLPENEIAVVVDGSGVPIGFIPSSWFTITVSPASIGTMLDISIELLDWQFNVISTSNPRDSLSATVSHTPQPEIGGEPKPFYIRIDGYGKDGEYSDYSSIGEWKMKTHSQNAAPPIERNRIRDWALFTYDTYQ